MNPFRQPTPDCEWCEMPRGPEGCGPCSEAFNSGRASMLAEVKEMVREYRATANSIGSPTHALDRVVTALARVKP